MNWFDLVIIILIAVTLIKGYTSGLIMQLASLAGIILGAIFVGKLSEWVAPKLIEITGASPHIVGVLSYIVAFLLIVIAMYLLGKTLQSMIKVVKMDALNRVTGAFFCSVKWLVIFSILLNLVVGWDQDQTLIKKDVRENAYTYQYVTKMSSIVIPYLKFDWLKQKIS